MINVKKEYHRAFLSLGPYNILDIEFLANEPSPHREDPASLRRTSTEVSPCLRERYTFVRIAIYKTSFRALGKISQIHTAIAENENKRISRALIYVSLVGGSAKTRKCFPLFLTTYIILSTTPSTISQEITSCCNSERTLIALDDANITRYGNMTV